jgi:predicted ester cyclase
MADHAANKRAVALNLRRLFTVPVADLPRVAAEAYAPDARLFAFHPVNDQVGVGAITDELWSPLRRSFPDLERRDQIVVSGSYQDKDFVCAMSFLQGTFAADWVGIPATGNVVTLRCCEINQVSEGRIVESHVLIDTLDVMRQANVWPIAPSLGTEAPWQTPADQHGVELEAVDHDRGAAALAIVKAMHAGLGKFDGKSLGSMDHARFWEPGFLWYGPSGIGTTKGLDGFEAHHQIPFLKAFPDRRVHKHIANIADGDYVVTGGWPSVIATHSGPDWLGVGPTGNFIRMRVMDFYRVDGDLIAENWVPIDIADMLLQMNVDVFARVRHRAGNPPRAL